MSAEPMAMGRKAGNIACDAEAVRDLDDLGDADAGGELEGGDVAGLLEGGEDAHGAFIVRLVVVGGVPAAGCGERDGVRRR